MDSRTSQNIQTLHPNARPWATAFIKAVEESGILPKGYKVRIISGNRTWAEQNALFAQGRTKPGRIVTNARGGQSNHNFGIAWDIGIFNDAGEYLGESPLYAKIGEIGLAMGLNWGGVWDKFKDLPHYEVKTGLSLATLRSLVQSGKPIPVPTMGEVVEPPPKVQAVEIYDHHTLTDIKAHLEGGKVWVAVRRFAYWFGGEVLEVDGGNAQVRLDKEIISVPLKNVDGTGFAKFTDLNRVLDWGFYYSAGRLAIDTKEGL